MHPISGYSIYYCLSLSLYGLLVVENSSISIKLWKCVFLWLQSCFVKINKIHRERYERNIVLIMSLGWIICWNMNNIKDFHSLLKDLLAVQNEHSLLSLMLIHCYCVVVIPSMHEVARDLSSRSTNPSSTVIFNISVYWPSFQSQFGHSYWINTK